MATMMVSLSQNGEADMVWIDIGRCSKENIQLASYG